MGSSASKPARAAANAASRRQYPKQPSSPPTGAPKTAPKEASQQHTHEPQGPTYHSKEPPSSVKSEAIDLDARDPHFAASLRSIGPVQNPSPTLSHSSTFNQPAGPQPTGQPQAQGPTQTVFPQSSNPALLAVTARQRIAKAAEREAEEFGRTSHAGREFLDAWTLRQALVMRDQGVPGTEIERALRLKG
ncbi:hypothetical protein PHISP_08215, partial [Aspergillus sp. HF37]